VGFCLKVGEEAHGGEVGDGGDREEGRRVGGDEGWRAAEAVLEVGGGGEEHIPGERVSWPHCFAGSCGGIVYGSPGPQHGNA